MSASAKPYASRLAIVDAYLADKGLTPHQRDVLLVSMSSLSRASAAAQLGISEQTLKSHIKVILRKCDALSLGSLAQHILMTH